MHFPSHFAVAAAGLIGIGSIWAAGSDARAPRPTATTARRVLSIGLVPDELLLLIADREQLVGLTELTLDPDFQAVWAHELAGVARIASGAESVLAQAPDLVVASRWSPEATKDVVRSSGIALLTVKDVTRIDDIGSNLIAVGRALGREERARQRWQAFQAELDELRQRGCESVKRRVLLLGYGFAYGSNTLQHDWLGRIGAVNAAAALGHGALALAPEAWLELDPDWILVETAATELEREANHLLPRGALYPILEQRFHDRVIGIPRVYSGSTSTRVIRAMRAVAELICSG